MQHTYLDRERYIEKDALEYINIDLYKNMDVFYLPVIDKGRYIGCIRLMDLVFGKVEIMDVPAIQNLCAFDNYESEIDLVPFVDENRMYDGFSTKAKIENHILKKKLALVEFEFESILDSSQDGIHITDGSGVTVRFNNACERTDNVNRKDIIGRPMEDMVEEGVYSESVALKVRDLKRPVSVLQTVNGKEIMATGTPIFKDEKLFRIVVNSRDVTELAEIRRKLEKAKTANEEYKMALSKLENGTLDNIVFRSKSMETTLDLVSRVSKVNSTVLIHGESGVGKGVLAKLIHHNSPRSTNMFMKIDCSVIPEKLLESELFGYEKGAFTGASEKGKIGLVELAHGGTLFLDEIGEVPLSIQAKLLTLIQDKQFKRIGGKSNIQVDIRIIAATNKNLSQQVKQGAFREDLFYRLNVIPITIKPLRERIEDIYPLIESVLQRMNTKYGWSKVIDPLVINALIQYSWPGNVRELENIVERMAVVSLGQRITLDDLPVKIEESQQTKIKYFTEGESYTSALLNFEKALLQSIKEESKNTLEMAEKLNLDRSTVRRKMKRCGVGFEF